MRSLASLYDVTTGAIRDTNGDGLADSVAARVIVPAEPAVEDVQGAANIAGRLGFETTALTLPIVIKSNEVAQPASIAVPILVGRSNPLVKPSDRSRCDRSEDAQTWSGPRRRRLVPSRRRRRRCRRRRRR